MSVVFQTETLRIETESSEIPWLKIFTVHPYTEMSEVPENIRQEIYTLLDIIEKEMLSYYNPTKINIASFGNYLPHLHWHIMARFEQDSYYPEPMWGTRQREGTLSLPSYQDFCANVASSIAQSFPQ